ncbi:hypothetical protein Droror1_Dr00022390 [Drosera rotundifolia]
MLYRISFLSIIHHATESKQLATTKVLIFLTVVRFSISYSQIDFKLTKTMQHNTLRADQATDSPYVVLILKSTGLYFVLLPCGTRSAYDCKLNPTSSSYSIPSSS